MAGIDYHTAASDEAVQAYNVYSEIDPNVGERFKIELERAEQLVERSPEAWGPYFYDTYGFQFRGFPFVMAYIIDDDRIVVIAIAHTRRKPGYWRDRLP